MSAQKNFKAALAAANLLRMTAGMIGLSGTPVMGQQWYRGTIQSPQDVASFVKQEAKGAVKLGPVLVNVSTQGSVEQSDNVLLVADLSATRAARATPAENLTEPVGPQDGMAVVLGVILDAGWQAGREQMLKIRGEFTHRQILAGPGKNRQFLSLSPGSALRYTVYIGGIRVMPFLNMSRQIDPIAAQTVNNTDSYQQESYDLGGQIDVPLHRLTLQAMGLRGFKISQSEQMQKTKIDRSVLSFRLTRTLTGSIDVGADAFWVAQEYQNGSSESSTSQTYSVFGALRLSQGMRLKGTAGINWLRYDGTKSIEESSANVSPHGEIELSHRIRQNIEYVIRYSQSFSDGTNSNYILSKDLSFSPTIAINERASVQLESGLTRVTESTTKGETSTRLMLGARMEFVFRSNFTFRGGVRFLDKISSIPSRGYVQTSMDLTLLKQF